MAKKKQQDGEQGEAGKSIPAAHLMPQAERTEPVKRPEAIDEAHLSPQEEVAKEKRKVKVVDPAHLKPQA